MSPASAWADAAAGRYPHVRLTTHSETLLYPLLAVTG
jgi:hypothetical protein